MEVSPERFEFALRLLRSSDWERFERLASAFLASEWNDIRTTAAPGGDGGRDSELFSPRGLTNVVIQYSVQVDWAAKIRQTFTRLKASFPTANILVFVSNQQIGAKADTIKRMLSADGTYLDVRDRSWFVERTNLDKNRSEAAAVLARAIVDPLLESKSLVTQSAAALTGQDAKTALLFLELQWRNESVAKGLTKSAFDALVRGALHGTNSSNRMSRQAVYKRVFEFLPKHPLSQMIPYIDAALKRLSRSAVRHWTKGDEFNLSYEEIERLKDEAAAIELFKAGFEDDVAQIANDAGCSSQGKADLIVSLTHKIIERYFFQRGEEFAASLARDTDPPVDEADLRSIVIPESPAEPLIPGRENVAFLLQTVRTELLGPSDAAREYLRLLSDSYTLFAFLEEAPDVQKVTKKLFNHGKIWLDTSVLLPVFAEQAFPESLRPFTAMFEQAKRAGMKLVLTSGIVEEIERHLNRSFAYTQAARWEGRVPYVYAQYALAGRAPSAFASWLEQFRGQNQPLQDIADYLLDLFELEVEKPVDTDEIDPAVAFAIREYWREIHDKRRPSDGYFNISANRLAEHDSECCMSVLNERQMQRGKSPLGFESWWLTLDSAARKMLQNLNEHVSNKIRHSPVISVDFLLKYLAFGPRRDRIDHSGRDLPYAFAAPILETLPSDLLEVAKRVRSENLDLSERIIQRRIRDALDREKTKAGPVQLAGLDAASEAIEGTF